MNRALWARERAQRLMLDSGTILRTVLIDDGAGGVYPDPGGPTAVATVLGQFRKLSGDELVRAAQIGQAGRYQWAVPHDTAIEVTDQVQLLGQRYNVVWAPPSAALDADRIVGLEEA